MCDGVCDAGLANARVKIKMLAATYFRSEIHRTGPDSQNVHHIGAEDQCNYHHRTASQTRSMLLSDPLVYLSNQTSSWFLNMSANLSSD